MPIDRVGRRITLKTNKGLVVTGGKTNGTLLVVCDKPSVASQRQGEALPPKMKELFFHAAAAHGLEPDDFIFVSPCLPMPSIMEGSSRREGEFLEQHRDEFVKVVQSCKSAKMIITLGPLAARQVYGSSVKITKIRGVVQLDTPDDMRNLPLIPIISPQMVLRFPSQEEVFRVDFAMISRMKDCNFSVRKAGMAVTPLNYRWVDGDEFVAHLKKWRRFSLDTETTGIPWHAGHTPFMVQSTGESGVSVCCPIAHGYMVGDEQCKYNRVVVRKYLQNPKSDYYVVGHNMKFDLHCLANLKINIPLERWLHDTMQLLFCMDENIISKDLDNATKLLVPERGGYADQFNATTDKSGMIHVPPKRLLEYAGGDSDVTFRLCKRLVPMVKRDERQWACYEKIQMPALRMFYKVERRGMLIDKDELRNLTKVVSKEERRVYEDLIKEVPGSIKRKHLNAGSKGDGTGLAFSRGEFVKDIMFNHKDGFCFEPQVFTKSTKNLPDDQKEPSVSKKDHLPYFDDEPWVAQLIHYQTVSKLLGSFVGKDKDKKGQPSGIWKYICADGHIRPSYHLHRTVTGRTASSDPNGQNFPKRGDLAMAYRKIFVPRKGFVFGEADLSQAELRVAAWNANERNMLRLYQQGEDIHSATGAAIAGISLAQFKLGQEDESMLLDVGRAWKGSDAYLSRLAPDSRKNPKYGSVKAYMKNLRQQAKAVNFGFLYGMGWKKFRSYAKTTYQINVSEADAQKMRQTFFSNYPGLEPWHKAVRQFVRENGYVRSVHGAVRHLANIRSYDEGVQGEAERQAINSPVQRTASDIGLIGANRFDRDCPEDIARVVAFIHDAVILEIKEGYEQEVLSAIRWYLENPPLEEWFDIRSPVPIIADVSLGRNLGEMKELHLPAKCPKWFREELDFV